MKIGVIGIFFALLLTESDLSAITKHYNINRPKNTKDIKYPYNTMDILGDMGWAILYSLGGGYSSVHGNITGAIIGTSNGVKNFLEAVEKYQENLQVEREFDQRNFNGYEPIEKDYDQGYDAYDNANR